MRVALITLGCAKNQVDAEVMAACLLEAGHRLVEDPSSARALVINTCAFISDARAESIETILHWATLRRSGRLDRLVVTGCLAGPHRRELVESLPEVDAFLAPAELERIVEALSGPLSLTEDAAPGCHVPDRAMPRLVSSPPGTAYLKIADGCDNCCAYCRIPQIRGPFRSRPSTALLQEAETLLSGGARELVLIAQDTLAYGRDLPGEIDLPELIRRLVRLPGLVWVRLLYAYPDHLEEDLMELYAREPRLAPYLDLPMQHADPHVLAAMGRRTDARLVLQRMRRLRQLRPGMAFRTTMMVGHPGEDRRAFLELCDFVRQARFDHLGVFRYSPEAGTASAALPRRPVPRTGERRWWRLMELQGSISRELLQERLHQSAQVLLQGIDEQGLWGRTAWQAPDVDGIARLEGDGSPGEIRTGRIVAVHDDYDVIVRLDEAARPSGEGGSW